jgi:hypothetical protein
MVPEHEWEVRRLHREAVDDRSIKVVGFTRLAEEVAEVTQDPAATFRQDLSGGVLGRVVQADDLWLASGRRLLVERFIPYRTPLPAVILLLELVAVFGSAARAGGTLGG